MPRLRIAILECDTPLDGTRAKYGGYGGVFKALLTAAAPPSYELEIASYDVVTEQAYPDVKDVDGILLTGSRHSAYDHAPWIEKLVKFTHDVLDPADSSASTPKAKVPVVGVCFGHQIVARALGGQCIQNPRGWEASVLGMNLTSKGEEVFGRRKLALHQMHRDVVPELPPAAQLLGNSPRCDVQGFYIPHRCITVQGHPEFNKTIVEELLRTRHDQGIFNDEVYEEAMKRVGNDQDGVLVGRAFIKFLTEG